MQFKCIFNDKSRSKCCFEWHFEWHQNIVKNRILNSICRKRPFLFHKQDHFVSFSLYSLPWISCCMIIALNFCIVSAKLSNFGCDRKPPWDIQAGTTFRYPICCGAGLSAGVLLQIHNLKYKTRIKYSKVNVQKRTLTMRNCFEVFSGIISFFWKWHQWTKLSLNTLFAKTTNM